MKKIDPSLEKADQLKLVL